MKKKPTAADTPQILPPPPEIVVIPRPLQRQQSILHNLAESRRENVITSSITRSISGANPSFYRSEYHVSLIMFHQLIHIVSL